jgi:DUF1365 family protein
MDSAIYRGWLSHRRMAPRPHAFRYPVYLMYLDLAELQTVFRGRWFWSTRRAAAARFDRRDHLGDPAVPLDVAVRDLVEERVGWRPVGPIRLLTHLRWFGYVFNPVSFYYCFGAGGTRVDAIVAEVDNTPWGERHCYVLDRPHGEAANGRRRYRSAKAMHVSPFMPMDLEYDWGFDQPGERLRIDMVLRRLAPAASAQPAGPAASAEPAPASSAEPGDASRAPCFNATLTLRREPVSAANLAAVLCRYPAMTVAVIAAIHWEALRLWLKRVPVFTHPARAGRSPGAVAPPDAAPGASLPGARTEKS